LTGKSEIYGPKKQARSATCPPHPFPDLFDW